MSLTYPGGFITKNPTAPTVNAAPGVWTLDQALQYIKAGTWPQPLVGDPYWQYTALLSGTGSTNGAQNNTFIDSSSNNFTITRNGNTTQGTFTPFTAPNGCWGNFFDGTNDWLTCADNTAFELGNSSFTAECWVFPTGTTGLYYVAMAKGGGGTSTDYSWQLGIDNNGLPYGTMWANGNGSGGFGSCTGPTSILTQQWYHLAYTRSGSNFALFVNGIRVATATSSSSAADTSANFAIGATRGTSSANEFKGFISNARLVKGSAVYDPTQTSITVPTEPLTAISGTSFLGCQSNRFVDNSTNAFDITINGTPLVVPFAPFGNTTAYSVSTVGGSSSTDGTGDYLTVPNGSAFTFTGDFTVEGWIYSSFAAITGGAGVTLIDTRNQYDAVNWSFGIYTYSGYVNNPQFIYSGGTLSSSINCTPNAWNHIALTRSGTTLKIFVNGVQGYSGIVSGTISTGGATNNTILSGLGGTNYLSPSFVSGLRILNGTGYSSISVPTAPPTAIANTSLLLNFTNAGIYDQAAKNDMETVGNAQVSTSVVKYGNGSMYFDGTGDWLTMPAGSNFAFGTGEFTIEAWIYLTTIDSYDSIFSTGTYNTTQVDFRLDAGRLNFYVGNGGSIYVVGSTTLSTNTWYHVAATRSGTTLKLYVNGNQDTSATVSTNLLSSGTAGIGTQVGNSWPFNGYISDLRVTNGINRYPYNFTPPAKSLPNFYQAQTLTADPYFDYTTLLLPGTGTNGAQNNTFLDSSTNAFSITRNGNTTQGTFSPFSQTGWSNYFDGTSDSLTLGAQSNFSFGTGDFTIEGWFFINVAGTHAIIDFRPASTNGLYILLAVNSSNQPYVYVNSSQVITGSALSLNIWNHFALTRSGTSTKLFINGVQSGSTYTDSNNYIVGTSRPMIGALGFNPGAGADLNGYLSNVRIVKGTAVYTSNFTPPTAPLTAITNTSLLTCQSNRFVDNSSNAFAITVNGNTSVQAFSPFAPTAAYSATTNGGSGYFDGTADYLSVPNNTALNLSSGDWTIEFWTYVPSGVTSTIFLNKDGVYGSKQPQYDIELNSSRLYARIGDSSGAGTFAVIWPATTFPYNQWVHVEFVKSGSTIYLFQNGVSMGTASTIAMVDSGNPLYIGTESGSPTTMNGYISGIRILKGTAAHTTSFTPPTAPPTAITNTQLLLNFTNAGITDATAKNDLETVGNAQISNTTAKFGSTSIKFDGTGDYLIYPDNVNWAFGSGDFTIEGWIYNAGTNGFIIAQTDNSTAAGSSIVLYLTSGALNALMYYGGSSFVSITDASTFPTNQWVHIALTRYGGTATLFVNGISRGTASLSTNSINDVGLAISIGARTNGNDAFTGYIQDFRITKGIARYTQNFTPPTAAFQLL